MSLGKGFRLSRNKFKLIDKNKRRKLRRNKEKRLRAKSSIIDRFSSRIKIRKKSLKINWMRFEKDKSRKSFS